MVKSFYCQIMNIRILFFLLLPFVFACTKHKGYTEVSNDLYMKLHVLGESSDSIRGNDFVMLSLSYATNSDSVFYTRNIKFQVKDSVPGIIDKALKCLVKGDSATFIVLSKEYFEHDLGAKIPKFVGEYFHLSIQVDAVQTFENYSREREQFLAWVEDFHQFEQVFLKQYITTYSLPADMLTSGMYKVPLGKGVGRSALTGDTVSVQYAGKFLNGKYFDSDTNNKRNFQFVLGTEWQVVKGLETAIHTMKEGERSLFIMPSDLAFGSEGSSTGIIPPYTSVVFEVQLDKVSPGDTLTNVNIL